MKKSVWYLPYFVTSQAKKRIVYEGRAEFDNVCVNEFIETGPDLLNSLADILASLPTRTQLNAHDIKTGLEICSNSTVFSFQNVLYRQTFGTPMDHASLPLWLTSSWSI